MAESVRERPVSGIEPWDLLIPYLQSLLQLLHDLEVRGDELTAMNQQLRDLNRNLVGREYRIRELELQNQQLRMMLEKTTGGRLETRWSPPNFGSGL